MRRIGLTVAGCALLTALVITPAATAGPLPSVTLKLDEATARHVQTFPVNDTGVWTFGRTLVYWGKFTSDNTQPGSYRATCTWLAADHWPNSHKQDRRLSCTVVLAFKAPPSAPPAAPNEPSGLVLEGLVKRPKDDGPLFARPGYRRQLAITGGSGAYRDVRGRANIRQRWKIIFPDGLPPA
jgi:hypothetical protein